MSDGLLIQNARLVTPTATWDPGWVLCQGKRIAALGYGAPPHWESVDTLDAGGLMVLPGFIDVHVHGAMGCEAMDASPNALHQMARFYARHGVTAFLATTWTDSRERITAALQAIAEAQGPQPQGATLVGAYLEGPYLNAGKTGAQNVNYIRRAEREEALSFLDFGVIRVLAVAPEYDENLWLISECVRRGITVSAAHTAATYEDIVRAVRLGLTHVTHTYNAMPALHHRDPGVLGAVMTLPQVRCELIADNIHVHPAAMQILLAAKGPQGVVLVTDAIRAAGMPDGEYRIDERVVIVREGKVLLPDGTIAGSTLTMNRALYNLMQATSQPVEILWPASSLNAARVIGMADRKGSIEVGKDADLVLVTPQLEVQATIAEGQIVYRR